MMLEDKIAEHPIEDWMTKNIPENHSGLDDETWVKVTIARRQGCVARARQYRASGRKLTLDEETDLAVSWCCKDLPHPPIYYFPKVHAEEWVQTIGFSMEDGIIQGARQACSLCREFEDAVQTT